MTNLVNKDGSIKATAFRCLDKGESYLIVHTANEHNGPSFWTDSAFKAVDTVKRISDGAIKSYTREDLEKRFTNIKKLDLSWE